MQTLRKVTDQRKREGKTVAEILDEYEAWAKTEVRKPDGEMRPRIESWYGAIGYLRRFTRTALGSMVASEVENDHIAQVQNDIIAGRYGKPSVSNARQFRKSASAMFEWAAEAGRKYVKVNPCHHLPGLDSQPGRDRVLSAEEIKVLWWGLDDPALGCTRQIALALKFQLVTMLRSKEFLHSQPHEFSDLGTENARFTIPLKRVKKRRILIIPMSDLAQEIIAEARKLKDGKSPYVFPGKLDGEPLDGPTLGNAVLGFTDPKTGKVIRQGIWKVLGMKPWTPHDLRRTSASLARGLGIPKWKIAQCLDHRSGGDEEAPPVTDVYVHSEYDGEKKEVLDAVAKALREIIGQPPRGLKLVA